MAEDKKSFVLYTDLIHMVAKLPDDKAGQLFKHVLEYVNDMNPETKDILVSVAFEPIKQQLKRDLTKYESKKKQWSEAGKASARKRKEKQRTSTDVENRSTDSTVSVNDSDSVTVNVNDIDSKEKVLCILEYLNEATSRSFRITSSTTSFINARLKDNDIQDLKDVIDLKVHQWTDTEMSKYLRPQTLFNATKFESYLQEVNDYKNGKGPDTRTSDQKFADWING